jgi:hypothetical protein
MNLGRTVFSQLIAFLPDREFRRCAARHGGDFRVRGFSCWDQFLCMAFAQLTYRESLRDIEACLRSSPDKLYHMGIRARISRSTLANANERRDWLIFAGFAQLLINRARTLYTDDPFGVEIQHSAYALDSTTIDLSLALFPWRPHRLGDLPSIRPPAGRRIHSGRGDVHLDTRPGWARPRLPRLPRSLGFL